VRLYKVIQTTTFKRNLKKQSKKHRSLPADISILETSLSYKIRGNYLFSLETNFIKWDVYKIRLLCKSLGKGKRSGYRVIFMVNDEERLVLLITLYYKGDTGNLTDDQIQKIIDEIDP